jgi:hypothetical protein
VDTPTEGTYTRVSTGRLHDLGQGRAQILGTEALQPTLLKRSYSFNTSYQFMGINQVC